MMSTEASKVTLAAIMPNIQLELSRQALNGLDEMRTFTASVDVQNIESLCTVLHSLTGMEELITHVLKHSNDKEISASIPEIHSSAVITLQTTFLALLDKVKQSINATDFYAGEDMLRTIENNVVLLMTCHLLLVKKRCISKVM